jgi:hypothetical protein
MCTKTPQTHNPPTSNNNNNNDQPMAGIEDEERRPLASERQLGVQARREGEGVTVRTPVTEWARKRRAEKAREEDDWRFMTTVNAVVHALESCDTCKQYAHHVHGALLGDGAYAAALDCMRTVIGGNQAPEVAQMEARVLRAESERDMALARSQDLERRMNYALEDAASYRETMRRYQQQAKDAEDELRRPDKKRARISS